MNRRSTTSLLLVAAQFCLIALILSPLQGLLGSTPRSLAGLVLIGASTVLALWALAALKIHSFSIMPEPVASGSLTMRGPYRHVRHPMYASVLMASAGAALSHGTVGKTLWLVSLFIILIIKIRREEHFLKTQYPQYTDYSTRTAALVPGLY